MSTFTSEDYCTDSSNGYEGLFEHDRGTETVVIKNNLISDAIVGEARARAELIKGGYVERIVSIVGVHIPTLKVNDIISFKGVNWIVKEISLSFTTPKLIQSIKGVCYE